MYITKKLVISWTLSLATVAIFLALSGWVNVKCYIACPISLNYSRGFISFGLNSRLASNTNSVELLYGKSSLKLHQSRPDEYSFGVPEKPGYYSILISSASETLFRVGFFYLGGIIYMPYIFVGLSIFLTLELVPNYIKDIRQLIPYAEENRSVSCFPYTNNSALVVNAVEILKARSSRPIRSVLSSDLKLIAIGLTEPEAQISQEVWDCILHSAEDNNSIAVYCDTIFVEGAPKARPNASKAEGFQSEIKMLTSASDLDVAKFGGA